MILICHHCRFTTESAVGDPIETGKREAQAKGWDFRERTWQSGAPELCQYVLVSYCPHCALLVPA